MTRLAVFLCSLGFAPWAVADDQYWVSVGSYKSDADAARGRALAESRLSESIAITPADTVAGYFLRVVAGPYSSRDIAKSKMDLAHNAGYADAWVVGPAAAASWSSANSTAGLRTDLQTGIGADAGGDIDDYSSTSYRETDYSDYDYSTGYSSSVYSTEGDYSTDLVVDSSAELYELSRSDNYQREADAGAAFQPPELVDEAPASYQLHKLKRDK